jgi:hypothetical protein
LDADDFPGVGVGPDETLLPADSAMAERSKRVLAPDAETLNWRYGACVLTRSERWGLIWRTDVFLRSGSRARVVVFWSLPLEDEHYGTCFYSSAEPPLAELPSPGH